MWVIYAAFPPTGSRSTDRFSSASEADELNWGSAHWWVCWRCLSYNYSYAIISMNHFITDSSQQTKTDRKQQVGPTDWTEECFCLLFDSVPLQLLTCGNLRRKEKKFHLSSVNPGPHLNQHHFIYRTKRSRLKFPQQTDQRNISRAEGQSRWPLDPCDPKAAGSQPDYRDKMKKLLLIRRIKLKVKH